jgi:catechol 2,3-dioxygenase-like lactoylglutathione lyase family enzyme
MKWMMTLACAFALVTAPATAAEFGKPGLAGVRIGVKDDARSMRFYEILGMKVGRLHHPGQQEMIWEDKAQGAPLILVHAGPDSKLLPGGVSLMIFSANVAATLQALRAAGFSANDPQPNPAAIVEAAFPDPDGNLILLIGPKPKA